MTEQHYILIPSEYHSDKILQLINENQIQIGKSYRISKTPIIYDPITFKPIHKWILTTSKKKYHLKDKPPT